MLPLVSIEAETLVSQHEKQQCMEKQTGDRTDKTGHCGKHPSSAGRRRHSLSHPPTCDSRRCRSMQPLARRAWSGTDLGLMASLKEEIKWGSTQRDKSGEPSQKPQERNLELELNVMDFELFSLKQKQMESSFAHLEKEKQWLESNRSEDKKQRGDLDNNKRKSGSRAAFLDSSQKGIADMKNMGQELTALQESLAAHKKRIKALEAKQKEMMQQLRSDKEEKVELGQQVQHLTLELEGAQVKQEGICDQVSALQVELFSIKTQVDQQEKEKVLMKEELELTKQAKEKLSSEVAESCRRLGDSLEKLHLLEAEKKILDNRIQALENERNQLLEESGESPRHSQAEGVTLQESCENHRESQALLEKERNHLQSRCFELEEALRRSQEEMDNQRAEQEQVSQHWRDLWEEATAALKSKDEELAEILRQSQTSSAKGSWQEANPELVLVQEELQKARDVLKMRDEELEGRQQELEFARSQFAECLSEKERLEKLVTSLEKQVDEKEQALRDLVLRQAKDVDHTQMEKKMSSLELKGQDRGWDAKVTQSPQQERESLKRQHQLVTEQLKGLFKQREQHQQPIGPKTHPRGQSSVAPQKSPGRLATSESPSFSDDQPASLNTNGKAESLQEQLEEKTQLITSMASEIRTLKEKNENLTKAKLRFQQQIQEIRSISKPHPERNDAQPVMPRLRGSGRDLPSAQGKDISSPSLQSDLAVLSSLPSQETPQCPTQEPPVDAGKDQSGRTSDTLSTPVITLPLQSEPGLCGATVPSIKLSLDTLTSLQDSESEVAMLSPRSTTLLSPRPFGSPRPWSPFKLQGSPEPPEE